MLHMLLAVRLLCARNVGTADRRLSHALVPGGKSRLANLPGILSNITGVDSYQDLIWIVFCVHRSDYSGSPVMYRFLCTSFRLLWLPVNTIDSCPIFV